MSADSPPAITKTIPAHGPIDIYAGLNEHHPDILSLETLLGQTCCRFNSLQSNPQHWWLDLTLGPDKQLRGLIAPANVVVIQGPAEPCRDLFIALASQAASLPAPISSLIVDGKGCAVDWSQRTLLYHGGGPQLLDRIPCLPGSESGLPDLDRALISCDRLPIAFFIRHGLDAIKLYEAMWTSFNNLSRLAPEAQLMLLTGIDPLFSTQDDWERIRQWSACTKLPIILHVCPDVPIPSMPSRWNCDWIQMSQSASHSGHYEINCRLGRMCTTGHLESLTAWSMTCQVKFHAARPSALAACCCQAFVHA